MSNNNKKSGIANRLVLYILLFSSITTLLLTGQQLYFEYRKDVETLNEQFLQIESAFKEGVTQSYWDLDHSLMRLQLEGIKKLANIEKVEVVSTTDTQFMSVGEVTSKDTYIHPTPLVYQDETVKDKKLGTLLITGSRDNINRRLFERAINIALSQAIKTFLVAFFILWLIHYLVTRHLSKVAKYINQLNPAEPSPPLELDRKPRQDELQALLSNLNETQSRINSSYEALKEREKSLQQAIASRKETEKRANYEKARALMTLSLLDDAVLVTEDDGSIVLINEAAKNLFKNYEGELVGKYPQTIEQMLWQGKQNINLETLLDQDNNEYCNAYLKNIDRDDIPVSVAVRKIFPNDKKIKSLQNSVIIIYDLRQEQITKKMVYYSTHDFLTNLPNRYAFKQGVKNIPELLNKSPYAAIFMFDLDKFKYVNDTGGHPAGDALLTQLTTMLDAQLPENTMLYRLGGDEFGLIGGFENPEAIKELGELFRMTIDNYVFVYDHAEYNVSSSIGISILQKDMLDGQDLMVAADEACYRAKAGGGNRVVIQYNEDNTQHTNSLNKLNQLQQILKTADFSLFAQPILPCENTSKLPPRLEVLLRHNSEDGKPYTPLDLIQTAAQYGRISSLDIWVTEHTFSIAEKLIEAGWSININVSAQTLTNEYFLNLVKDNMSHYNFPVGTICLEITEQSVIRNISQTRKNMQSLHELGVMFAIDDFGSGFASYGFIRHLPISMIKIDGELIMNMPDDEKMLNMVNSIVTMSKSAQVTVAAEYVTDQEKLDIAENLGIDYIQGEVFCLSKPVETFYRLSPTNIEKDYLKKTKEQHLPEQLVD